MIDIAATGLELRQRVRSGAFEAPTTGQAPGYLQGNVVILNAGHAADFLLFCLNNPKPCPLIGLSRPGNPAIEELGTDLDIRTDVPRYRVFRGGELETEVTDVSGLWREDSVAFVLGCSFSFEEALTEAGMPVRHIERGHNVPMFRTSIPTIPGGKFSGPLVVSMRPYRRDMISKIVDLCATFPQAHGAPVYWGDPEGIGIDDINSPDYGDAVEILDDEIPVFWACGVTPQAAIDQAKPELCITHAPGYMLVSDVLSQDTPDVKVHYPA